MAKQNEKSVAVVHPIAPEWNETSEVLILGSFPSVKSREAQFFYGHPQNRFWRVLASIYGEDVPVSVEEKRRLLRDHRIAVWDVIASCEICGSSDVSIRSVVPNDLSPILNGAPIRLICVNGKTAEKYYRRYIEPVIGIRAVCLPSTSPANASWSLERLSSEWKKVLEPHLS